MKSTPFYLFIILIVTIFVGGQSSTESKTIIWNEDNKLTWDDFQDNPDYNYSDVSALSSTGILHYKGCENGKIIYKVKAYFEKNRSWVKEVARTDYHLAHEQLHFDITELYARKLRKALAKMDFKCGEEDEFDKFVSSYLMKWQKAQIEYDLRTHYSMKPEKQKDFYYLVNMEMSVYDHHK